MREINKLIIHCSATTNGRAVSVKEIDQWHRERGWKEIGYHYVILAEGMVEKGRDKHKIGAHCKGQNADSLGICMVGTDKFSSLQWVILRGLTKGLENQFPGCTIHGHREFNPHKACPGFSVKDWLKRDREPLEGEVLMEKEV